MSTGSYTKDFYATIKQLEADAHAVGLTMTSICKIAKISRATPDRWRRETPNTVMLVEKMQQVVRDEKARLAAGTPPVDLSKELIAQ